MRSILRAKTKQRFSYQRRRDLYDEKKREHMRASHSIFSKMCVMGILKAKYIYSTRVLYAKSAGRFFYTFTKYSSKYILEEAIHSPTMLLVKRAMLEMMENTF